MKKKILSLFLALVVIAASLAAIPGAKSKTKSYYSGDAMTFDNRIIIASANMSGIELFEVENKKLVQKAKIESFRAKYSGLDSYNSLVMNEEGGKLYVYAVDGEYLYKYNITDTSAPDLVGQEKDSAWDWFGGVEKSGNRIITIGTKGMKIWSYDLEIIDSYNLPKDKNQYNVLFSQNGSYIFDLNDDEMSIFDTNTRQVISTFTITASENHNRKVYNDPSDSSIYIADDESLKKFDFSGGVKKQFYHTSTLGYDVAGSGDYIYFSDGIGVVKSRKSDLKPVDWIHTSAIDGSGWAMGLRVATQDSKDYVIVFNNASIVLLDNNLDKLDSFKATEDADITSTSEPLSLSIDKNRAAVNSYVSLRGAGYGANEDLKIDFGGVASMSKAGEDGRFTQILQVPDLDSGRTDIKVTGEATGFSYSLGFLVE